MVSFSPSHSAPGERARSAHCTVDPVWDHSRHWCRCWK